METYFAPAERATIRDLKDEIEFASNNPVIDGLMSAVSGLLAVLNQERQILTVNTSLLEMLGIAEIAQAWGLRPGEALNCVHAHEPPAGCGTTKYCASCGAAIAMVTSLEENLPVEKKCAATVIKGGETVEICLLVKSSPLLIDGHRYLLLFLQDITRQERWAALERSFFHDLNNIIMGLVGASELLVLEKNPDEKDKLANLTLQLSTRLADEIKIQRTLAQAEIKEQQANFQRISTRKLISEVQKIFSGHPATTGKQLILPTDLPEQFLITDVSPALRVLTNMLVNAFEATTDTVRIQVDETPTTITFSVWNREAIPAEIALRIFQRHFSTKNEPGRGLGTYTMKLLGEQFLHGQVDFTTSEADGTVFRLTLPK